MSGYLSNGFTGARDASIFAIHGAGGVDLGALFAIRHHQRQQLFPGLRGAEQSGHALCTGRFRPAGAGRRQD